VPEPTVSPEGLQRTAEARYFEAAYPPASGASWEDRASGVPPNGDSLVCEGTYEGADVQIWDSGFAYYGDDLCQRLGWSAR
jgi:hypothetical protein